MKSKRKVAATAFVALALMLTTGATPALCPIERHVVESYQTVVAVYDQARRWGAIARLWVDPDAATVTRPVRAATKPQDVCQARPASVAVR